MTQEEILDYNKRCAEFLKGMTYIRSFPESLFNHSYKVDTSSFEKPFSDELTAKINTFQSEYVILRYQILLSELKFHSDWNWIMELVEAIEKLDNVFVKIHTGGTFIHPINDTKNYISKAYSASKKEAVIQAINKFLIWYKS